MIIENNINYKIEDLQNLKKNVTVSADGLMSKEDKVKLDGIEVNANKYTHPDTHPASMIVESDTQQFVSKLEKSTWNAKADKVNVTVSADGLMSKEDKVKLDGINNDFKFFTISDFFTLNQTQKKIFSIFDLNPNIKNINNCITSLKVLDQNTLSETYGKYINSEAVATCAIDFDYGTISIINDYNSTLKFHISIVVYYA